MSHNLKLFLGATRQFGTAQVKVITSWRDAEKQWIFHTFPGGLEYYRAQLPVETNAPIMILNHITVYSHLLRQNLGSAGTLALLRHFREAGSRVAFFRIGAEQGEDWAEAKVWKEKMFRKLGWAVLENHPIGGGDVPIMWHPMTGDLSGKNQKNRSASEAHPRRC
jgi:hypothetical protein